MAPICVGASEGCTPWALAGASGLVQSAGRGLTLPPRAAPPDVLWPVNSARGAVLRVDPSRRQADAAYYTGPRHGDGCYGGYEGGDSPSRAAVDGGGNLYVANRACGATASVTKIAYDERDCVDRDASGSVDTSHGSYDLLAFDSHDAWDDECIVWHTVVGEPGAGARPVLLATSAPPDGEPHEVLWVGLYNEMRLVELDPESGEPTGAVVETPGLTPYNGAVTPDGWMWIVGMSGIVARLYASDPANTYEPMLLDLGLIVQRVIIDERGLPWMANKSFVWKAVSEAGGFARLDLPDGGNIIADGAGRVWVAGDMCLLYGVGVDDPEDVTLVDPRLAPSLAQVEDCGLAVDQHRQLWVLGGGSTRASVIDLGDLSVSAALDDCNSNPCLAHPYIRGDISGFSRTINRRDRGSWTGRFERCGAEAGDLVLEANVPDSSDLTVQVRAAADPSALSGAPWSTPVTVVAHERYALPSGAGPWLDVRIELLATRLDEAPELRSLWLEPRP